METVDKSEAAQPVSLLISKDRLEAILQFDKAMRAKAKISILTPDARVLFSIALKGSTTVSDAMAESNTSYGGFFAVLRRLKSSSLIDTAKDDDDNRVRRLSIRKTG